MFASSTPVPSAPATPMFRGFSQDPVRCSQYTGRQSCERAMAQEPPRQSFMDCAAPYPSYGMTYSPAAMAETERVSRAISAMTPTDLQQQAQRQWQRQQLQPRVDTFARERPLHEAVQDEHDRLVAGFTTRDGQEELVRMILMLRSELDAAKKTIEFQSKAIELLYGEISTGSC